MIGPSPALPAELREPVLDVRRRYAQSYWKESWDRLLGNRIGMGAGIVILILVALALAAPLISNYVLHQDSTNQDLHHNFSVPSREHWLGSDELGRDTLTRLLFGAQVSLTVGFLAIAVSVGVGTAVGLLAGYYGGLSEDLLMRFVDILLSIPAIYLFILVASVLSLNVISLSFLIALVGWGGVARLVRGEVLSVKNRDFIMATRSVGASDARLMLRHLLPNVLPVMIVAASLGVGGIILVEAALDFIGLGVRPPTPSWGNMLSNSQSYFVHSAWLVALPGACIFITVLGLNIFGNAVRDAFDPRLK